MNKKLYKKRIIDSEVKRYLAAFGAVCIEGPRWCGKTWTSAFHSNSEIYIADPFGGYQNRRLAEMDPSLVLQGEYPRLIDEWQEVPQLWDAVRSTVDKVGKKGMFILTGSSTPKHKGILHSGAGRIARLRMNTMSLYESGNSDGKISLRDICMGTAPSIMTGEVELIQIIDFIVRGGWPENIGIPLEDAALLPLQYLNAIIEDDVYRLDGIRRDMSKMKKLLRSLARNESTTATNNTLKRDIKDVDSEDVDNKTVSEYLDIFNRLFLTNNQPPFSPSMRSSTRIKQMEKRHFCDPSLACALLSATPKKLIGDLNTLGFLFEALVERDLEIYASSFDGKLYHYQDYDNKEIDAVIELPDGTWTAFEIKLGANEIDAAAESLLSVKKAFENDLPEKAPKYLCVVCALSNAAYMREDGVYVVPVTSLKN